MNVGDKVRCISNTTVGPVLSPSDTLYTVSVINYNGNKNYFKVKEYPTNYFYVNEFKVVAQSIEELEKQLQAITSTFETESKKIKTKIAYMKETGLSVFDDMEYKVWAVLSELDGRNTDKLATAKAIAAIIKV